MNIDKIMRAVDNKTKASQDSEPVYGEDNALSYIALADDGLKQTELCYKTVKQIENWGKSIFNKSDFTKQSVKKRVTNIRALPSKPLDIPQVKKALSGAKIEISSNPAQAEVQSKAYGASNDKALGEQIMGNLLRSNNLEDKQYWLNRYMSVTGKKLTLSTTGGVTKVLTCEQ